MISHSTNKEGHNFHTEAKHRDKGKKRDGPPLLFLEFGIGIDISHSIATKGLTTPRDQKALPKALVPSQVYYPESTERPSSAKAARQGPSKGGS